MHSFQTQDLELAEISASGLGDETRAVRAAFPMHYAFGAASAMVYLEEEADRGTARRDLEEEFSVMGMEPTRFNGTPAPDEAIAAELVS